MSHPPTGDLVRELLYALLQRAQARGALSPPLTSVKWYNWLSVESPTRCKACADLHGKIYSAAQADAMRSAHPPIPPLHPCCHCRIVPLRALRAGTATELEEMGADWYLLYYGRLPDYYISKKTARELGWVSRFGNLSTVAPGKSIFGGEFYNNKGKLPCKPGRKWFEADINYRGGFRGTERILFSNDGLIFVTYDHYETFIEVIE